MCTRPAKKIRENPFYLCPIKHPQTYKDCLYLKPEARGRGIAAQIMKQISEYAKTENCSTIQWQTPRFNANAIKFYKKLGATAKSKERFFWKV